MSQMYGILGILSGEQQGKQANWLDEEVNGGGEVEPSV
jgi:hypothetical protein